MQQLREACGSDFDKLSGIVEISETFISGKEKNKRAHKKLKAGRGTVGKQAVIGFRERGGRSIARPIGGTDQETLNGEIKGAVQAESTLHTDEHSSYKGLEADTHESVSHSAGEYVGPGDISTNGVESMWAVLKRRLHGTWHHASRNHLGYYVNECTFQLNDGNVKRYTLDRMDSFADQTFRHRITYAKLTA